MTESYFESIRVELFEAVTEAIDRVLGSRVPTQSLQAIVEYEGVGFDEWSYRWPSAAVETYRNCRWYRVSGESQPARALIGLTRRKAWNKMRDRYVVFGQVGSDRSKTFYPWTEFVAASHGRFGAVIPDPRRPRASIRDGAVLPPRFRGCTIERTDHLYGPSKEDSSLRIVVDGHDRASMIAHGYWVAQLRARL
jgi:hypothetical protein